MYPTFGRRVRGVAAAEFTLVAIPLLLVGLGALEVARWYLASQAVSLALLEGARAGAVAHASVPAIREAFDRGLAPLRAGAAPRSLPSGLPPWRIEVLSPHAGHFADFSRTSPTGVRAVSHAYQATQHQQAIRAGLPGGRGPVSGDTIYGANTLSLRATYLHQPLTPGIRAFLRGLGSALPRHGYAAQAMRIEGVLPIRQSLSIAMQSSSHESLAGTVVTPAGQPFDPAGRLSASFLPEAPACRGVWCDERRHTGPSSPQPPFSSQPPSTDHPESLPWVDLEQACDAALCCPQAAE